jgi:hypothetical protein
LVSVHRGPCTSFLSRLCGFTVILSSSIEKSCPYRQLF